jgi:putative glutamine amidotransferase
MKPLVGLPLCLDDRGRWRPGYTYQYLDAAYAGALDEAGAHPLHLPIQQEPEGLIGSLDGLLLPGGGDFLPPGASADAPGFDPLPERQLDFDRRLLAAALEAGLPILGICYGMQLLALHHGAHLLYDIPTDAPEAGDHRLPERDGRHGLELASGTRLAASLDGCADPVNSLHHQTVSEPGPVLVASAWSPDGLIEAIEHPDRRFCIGVQWHPEKMEGPHRERLFGTFVAVCREGG